MFFLNSGHPFISRCHQISHPRDLMMIIHISFIEFDTFFEKTIRNLFLKIGKIHSIPVKEEDHNIKKKT